MRILQIVKTNDGAKWAYIQAKWLFKNGVDIITVLPSKSGGMAEKYKENGMKVIEGDCTFPVFKPWELFKRSNVINSIITDEKPDLIHCHFVTNILMIRLALRKSNIPRLFQVPGPLHLESKIFRKAELMLSQNNDFWAGACKKTCDIYLNSGITHNKVFLAYYGGYGGKVCDSYKERKNKLRNEFKISADTILIGMISYFYKPKVHLLQLRGLKGHEDFIDAISLVREKNPKIIGIIIGGAWGNSQKYFEKVKIYAKKKCGDGIIFTGFRNDMKDIYKEIDVAVHPSHSENLGGAAESLAAGVPTISSNVGGFTDIVIDDSTGFTVPPKSSKKLASAILKMIESPKLSKEMSENGRQLVTKMLDIEKTGEVVLSVYSTILYGGKK